MPVRHCCPLNQTDCIEIFQPPLSITKIPTDKMLLQAGPPDPPRGRIAAAAAGAGQQVLESFRSQN
ncbi:MAG: hypothetical protein DU429_06330 [Candidatus Tokpelaia sp.]|nr:MAG: hypothetical protein DU430_01710 [Candidatus Tokpelaia sp.]KAA6206334.1 MAG: hypothetical protein DU429_06330 [Candidatus Tokpelaia sp.]